MVEIIGHRGARGLAPENTLAGLARALELGVDGVEIDATMTADGVLVLHHDRRLLADFARDATGAWVADPGPAIIDLDFAALGAHDVGRLNPERRYGKEFPEQVPHDGARVPSLAEFFDFVRAAGADHLVLNIEIKINPLEPDLSPPPEVLAEALVAAVRAAGMAGQVVLQGFNWHPLRHIHAIAPDLALAGITGRAPWLDNLHRPGGAPSPWLAGLDRDGASVPAMVRALGAGVWSSRQDDLSAETVAEAHALGLSVMAWTVNQPEDMARVIDLGVDGVLTDYPDRLRTVLAARGQSLPPPLTA